MTIRERILLNGSGGIVYPTETITEQVIEEQGEALIMLDPGILAETRAYEIKTGIPIGIETTREVVYGGLPETDIKPTVDEGVGVVIDSEVKEPTISKPLEVKEPIRKDGFIGLIVGIVGFATILGLAAEIFKGKKGSNPHNPGRPPKAWWDKISAKTRNQYPDYSEERIRKITGGIWQNYDEATRKRLIREYG